MLFRTDAKKSPRIKFSICREVTLTSPKLLSESCRKKLNNVTHLVTTLTLHPDQTKPHELYTEHISDVHCNDILFRSHTTLLLAIPIIIAFGINGIVLSISLEIFSLKPFPLTNRMIGRMIIFGSWTCWIFDG